MSANYQVRPITPEDARPLRHRVLWPHKLSLEECLIPEDRTPGAIHLGVYDRDRLISIGSLFNATSPKISFSGQYRLRAMATDPLYHGEGAGRLLILEALQILKRQGEEVLWCDARMKAIPFYQRLGFHLLEGVYEVPLIGPHQFMYYIL